MAIVIFIIRLLLSNRKNEDRTLFRIHTIDLLTIMDYSVKGIISSYYMD